MCLFKRESRVLLRIGLGHNSLFYSDKIQTTILSKLQNLSTLVFLQWKTSQITYTVADEILKLTVSGDIYILLYTGLFRASF